MKTLIVLMSLVGLLSAVLEISAQESPPDSSPAATAKKGSVGKLNSHKETGNPKTNAAETNTIPAVTTCPWGNPIEQPHTKNKTEQAQEAPLSPLYKGYLWATIIGVAGAWIGLIILICQTLTTRKIANAAISTERAWLIATMQQESIPSSVGPPSQAVPVFFNICTVKNYGKTPAWVTSFVSKGHLLVKGESLPDAPNYTLENSEQGAPIGESVLPPGDPIKQAIPMSVDNIKDVLGRKLTFYVYGRVLYRDAFSQKRETRFCYRYHNPVGFDMRPEGFYEEGPQKYIGQS